LSAVTSSLLRIRSWASMFRCDDYQRRLDAMTATSPSNTRSSVSVSTRLRPAWWIRRCTRTIRTSFWRLWRPLGTVSSVKDIVDAIVYLTEPRMSPENRCRWMAERIPADVSAQASCGDIGYPTPAGVGAFRRLCRGRPDRRAAHRCCSANRYH